MLDKLTKTQYVDFHLVPRPICGYINFVHNQGTLTHSALAGTALICGCLLTSAGFEP